MKRTIFLFLFILFCGSRIHAQIEYSIFLQHVKCNASAPGSIEINVVDSNPPYTYLWNTGQTSHMISNLEAGYYSVTITDAAGNDTLVGVELNELQCEMSPELVFTPNGDGYNDSWFIKNAQYFPDAQILVYDRLGQKVYEHNGLYNEAWEGRNRLNVPLPSASYYYVLYQDRSDESTIKKGSVTIIR